MTACTQPSCTGTIVDGYCDVCGSPAGAPRFVPAEVAASLALPVPAARTGFRAGPGGSGFPLRARNCTQRGCTGTIVDGYCDVCGSPPGAPPFIPAVLAASAPSLVPAARTGPTAGRGGSGFPPRPRSCTQRGCTGTIVDGYCDVCGSPAGAPPFVPAGAAAKQPNLAKEDRATQQSPRVQVTTPPPAAHEVAGSAAADLEEENPTRLIPRVQMTSGPPAAQEVADSAAADLEEESPTRLIPRVQMTTPPPAAQEFADSAAADPRAGTENVDEEEEADLAASRQELSSQGLRHSLVDMELMIASIRSGPVAADAEKADAVSADSELVADQSVEAVAADSETTETTPTGPDDHDTVQMPPVGAVAADSEVVDGDRVGVVAADSDVVGGESADVVAADVEVVDGEGVDVVAAGSEEVDGEGGGVVAAGSVEVGGKEVHAVAAVSEKTDTTPTGTDDHDTVQMAAVGAVPGGGRHPPSQRPEQHVLEPVPVQNPAAKKRRKSLALGATALAALLIGAWFFGASSDGGSVPAQPASTVTATATAKVSKSTSEASDESTDSGRGESTIQLGDLPDSAMPFQTVSIQGRYRGRPDVFLRVQRWEGGKWVDFPLPTKTDQSGQFTAYVEFGQPGRYTLRVQDPAAGLTSETFVLVIKG
jgi:hypothetical protein